MGMVLIILQGNVTTEPVITERRKEDKTYKIANFSVAVNDKRHKDDESEPLFMNCAAFGSRADYIEKVFHKGSRILIEGRIIPNNYTNKSGEKVYGYNVICDQVRFDGLNNNASKAEESEENSDGYLGLDDTSVVPPEFLQSDEELPYN